MMTAVRADTREGVHVGRLFHRARFEKNHVPHPFAICTHPSPCLPRVHRNLWDSPLCTRTSPVGRLPSPVRPAARRPSSPPCQTCRGPSQPCGTRSVRWQQIGPLMHPPQRTFRPCPCRTRGDGPLQWSPAMVPCAWRPPTPSPHPLLYATLCCAGGADNKASAILEAVPTQETRAVDVEGWGVIVADATQQGTTARNNNGEDNNNNNNNDNSDNNKQQPIKIAQSTPIRPRHTALWSTAWDGPWSPDKCFGQGETLPRAPSAGHTYCGSICDETRAQRYVVARRSQRWLAPLKQAKCRTW